MEAKNCPVGRNGLNCTMLDMQCSVKKYFFKYFYVLKAYISFLSMDHMLMLVHLLTLYSVVFREGQMVPLGGPLRDSRAFSTDHRSS